MSQEALDLRRSVQIVRRHKLLMGIMVILGLLAGGAFAVLDPPLVTSTALVLLPQAGQTAQSGAAAAANGTPDPFTATEEVIAKSNPVLAGALPKVHPATSLNDLRKLVSTSSPTPYIISINAQGKTSADATDTANAVAQSYIRYVGAPSSPGGQITAQLLQEASSSSGSSLLKQLLGYAVYALVGAIFSALIGAIIAIAISRSDRRLRARDEIANSIGVPVLASFPVGHPSDPGEWARLLEDYKPGALHALQLRKALQQLEMAAADANFGRDGGRWSFTVLSLTSDPGALALGPQLAIFAATQGIATALVIGPQQDATVTAALRTACVAPPTSSKMSKHLRVIVSDGNADLPRDVMLAVVVAVVDGKNPQVSDTMRTTTTLLGVSAGAVTADQLARVAVSADSDGREIPWILVADPDSADATTGRLPQLGRPGHRRMPTRMTGITTEIRR
jgi:capsular polysaccharide biosynthesis protein